MSPACRPACAAPASELLAHVSEHPPSVSLLLSACITPHLPSAFQHCKLFTAHNTCWVIIVDHQMAGMICRRPTQPWSCNRRLTVWTYCCEVPLRSTAGLCTGHITCQVASLSCCLRHDEAQNRLTVQQTEAGTYFCPAAGCRS